MAATRKKKTAEPKTRAAARKTPASRRASPGRSQGLRLTGVAPSFTVDDVEASLEFYRDVLGFSVGERWEDNGKLLGVELSAGKSVFMIGQDDWKKGRDRQKGVGFRLYCETDQDPDQLAAGIRARGGTVDGPHDEEWGGRAFTIVDPDGFKVTISRPLTPRRKK